MYLTRKRTGERATGFRRGATAPPGKKPGHFSQPLHAPGTYLLSLFSGLSRYREG